MPLSFHPLSLLPLLFSSSSSVSRFFLVCARTETHSLNSPPPPSRRSRRRTLCGIGTNKGGGEREGREGQGRGPNKGGRARSIGKERAPFAPLGGPGPTSQRERERAGWAGEGIRQQVRRAGEGAGGRRKRSSLLVAAYASKQKGIFLPPSPFPPPLEKLHFPVSEKGGGG